MRHDSRQSGRARGRPARAQANTGMPCMAHGKHVTLYFLEMWDTHKLYTRSTRPDVSLRVATHRLLPASLGTVFATPSRLCSTARGAIFRCEGLRRPGSQGVPVVIAPCSCPPHAPSPMPRPGNRHRPLRRAPHASDRHGARNVPPSGCRHRPLRRAGLAVVVVRAPGGGVVDGRPRLRQRGRRVGRRRRRRRRAGRLEGGSLPGRSARRLVQIVRRARPAGGAGERRGRVRRGLGRDRGEIEAGGGGERRGRVGLGLGAVGARVGARSGRD